MAETKRNKGDGIDPEELEYVQAWLRSVLPGSDQTWEVTPETLAVMLKLAKLGRHGENEVQKVALQEERLAREYDSEANRLDEILASTGINVAELPKELDTALDTQASLADMLECRDARLPTLLCALTDLELQHNDLLDARDEADKQSQSVESQLYRIVDMLNMYRRISEKITESSKENATQNESKKQQLEYFAGKAHEYEKSLELLKAKLRKGGQFSSALTHDALVDTDDEVTRLQHDCETLTAKLETYHDLPPDINLAKVTIEEARIRLQDLEKKLSASINAFSLGAHGDDDNFDDAGGGALHL